MGTLGSKYILDGYMEPLGRLGRKGWPAEAWPEFWAEGPEFSTLNPQTPKALNPKTLNP